MASGVIALTNYRLVIEAYDNAAGVGLEAEFERASGLIAGCNSEIIAGRLWLGSSICHLQLAVVLPKH